ncbi:MAG: IS200/IS605 family transposase [Planctomycetota bacterium]|nr:IS200/IS605 family transposase [Planctomycetota bacterium]MDA1138539.1 IS200/IS605 family transposase [Planctomycetota bacterium]
MSEENLTDRQLEILTFLAEFIDDKEYPPTLKEIGDNFGIKHPNGVRNHLLALEKKGFIEKGAERSRAIRIKKRPKALSRAIAQVKERVNKKRGIYYSLEVYLAWCTRKGRRHLEGAAREDVKNRLEQTIVDHDWELVRLDIQPTHVLMTLRITPDHSVGRVVRNFKNATAALWLLHPLRFKGRGLWASGYVAATTREDRDAMLEDFLSEKKSADDAEEEKRLAEEYTDEQQEKP